MLNAPFADTPLRLTYGGAKNQKAILQPDRSQAIARCLAAGLNDQNKWVPGIVRLSGVKQ